MPRDFSSSFAPFNSDNYADRVDAETSLLRPLSGTGWQKPSRPTTPVAPPKPTSSVKIPKNEMVTMDGEIDAVKLFAETDLFFDGKLELVSNNGVNMYVLGKQESNQQYPTVVSFNIPPNAEAYRSVPKTENDVDEWLGLNRENTYLSHQNERFRAPPSTNLVQGFQILNNPVSVSSPNMIHILKSIPRSSTLNVTKNMTYDIRAEPPASNSIVSPFLNSSIMPDGSIEPHPVPPVHREAGFDDGEYVDAETASESSEDEDDQKENMQEFINTMLKTKMGKDLIKSTGLGKFMNEKKDEEVEKDDENDETMEDYTQQSSSSAPTKKQTNHYVKSITINFKGIPIASNVETDLKLSLANNAKIVVKGGTTVFMELNKGEWTEVTVKNDMVCRYRE
jgi:hypothetical protein